MVGVFSASLSSLPSCQTHSTKPGQLHFQLHFTPSSASWLNLVEQWFRELTDKRIRRGAFPSVPELIAAMQEFIATNNDTPKPFVWTAGVEKILQKMGRCKVILETLH
jgi:DDE superfamily endonuclease